MGVSSCRVEILGVGSPFGMDRLGWLMAEQLADISWDAPGFRVSVARCPSPAHLPALTSDSQAVLVMDFAEHLEKDLCLLDMADISEERATSTHGLNLVDMLQVAACLNPGLSAMAILALGPGRGDDTPENRAHGLYQPVRCAIEGWLQQKVVLPLCKYK